MVPSFEIGRREPGFFDSGLAVSRGLQLTWNLVQDFIEGSVYRAGTGFQKQCLENRKVSRDILIPIDTQKKLDLQIFGVTFVKKKLPGFEPSIYFLLRGPLLYRLGLQHTTVVWVDITYLTVA